MSEPGLPQRVGNRKRMEGGDGRPVLPRRVAITTLVVLIVFVASWHRSSSAVANEAKSTAEAAASVTATATESPTPAFTLTPTEQPPTEAPTETSTQPSTPLIETPMPVAPSPTEAPPTVEPTSSPEPTATSTATQSPPTPIPTLDPPIVLEIQQANVDFGAVNALGEVDPGVRGVTSKVDEDGAYYVRLDAITLTVASESAWSGACWIDASSAGRVEWRMSGTDEWFPFQAGPVHVPSDNSCFPARSTGTTSYTYDLRLHVTSSDPEGPFTASIGFAVES